MARRPDAISLSRAEEGRMRRKLDDALKGSVIARIKLSPSQRAMLGTVQGVAPTMAPTLIRFAVLNLVPTLDLETCTMTVDGDGITVTRE